MIGLDADEVRTRVKQGKPPFKDREEQRMRCAKKWTESKRFQEE